jgi:RsiW-degrading membrane proteinase PrsW (M82 family)
LPPLRLLIYYGLLSGLGFGFYEGIRYQTDSNVAGAIANLKGASQSDEANILGGYYLDNVLRLTSAPFFHAVWTGIAAFFIWFGVRFKAHRVWFFALAIAVPAVYHGLYDGFMSDQIDQPALTILVALLSAALLTVYVGTADHIQKKMEFIVGERTLRPGVALPPKA